MNNQFFQRWQIDGVANEKYDVDNIAWTSEGLVFVVVPDGTAPDRSVQKLSLIWESSSVISYHVTDETYVLIVGDWISKRTEGFMQRQPPNTLINSKTTAP